MSDARANSHDPAERPLSAEETIERLCALVGGVHDRLNNYADPCDCFCPARGIRPGTWRSTGEALSFVERVVREALAALPSNGTGNDSECLSKTTLDKGR